MTVASTTDENVTAKGLSNDNGNNNSKNTAIVSSLTAIYLLRKLLQETQKSMTAPPFVYHQTTPQNTQITKRMGHVLQNPITPHFLYGFHPLLNSMAGYALPGPSEHLHTNHYRESVAMPNDGASIAIDWEFPSSVSQETIKNGLINLPVIVILHGINNDTSFGYIRYFMRKCVLKGGWVAVGMNFRGCGGEELKTPRAYNGAYTGDLRRVVELIGRRLCPKNGCLFVAGNSIGANIVVKYLGEEGEAGSLPRYVRGGISLGNPLRIYTKNLSFPWGVILASGFRKAMFAHRKNLSKMNDHGYQKALRGSLFGGLHTTIGDIDEAFAPHMIRNSNTYPFETHLGGYLNGEEYWKDASSYRYINSVNVPLLFLSANDDLLVRKNVEDLMGYCLSNPNVIMVKTTCGGHLGWFEENGESWADECSVHFIQAVLRTKREDINGAERAFLRKRMAEMEGMNSRSKL